MPEKNNMNTMKNDSKRVMDKIEIPMNYRYVKL